MANGKTEYEAALAVASSINDLCVEVIEVGDDLWLQRPRARKHMVRRLEGLLRQVSEEGVLDAVPDYKPGVLARLMEVRRFLRDLSLFLDVPEAIELPERPAHAWN